MLATCRLGCKAQPTVELLQAALKFLHLLLRSIARDSITLLHFADEILAVAFGLLQVIVRELSPFRLELAGKLFPLALDPVFVHDRLLWFVETGQVTCRRKKTVFLRFRRLRKGHLPDRRSGAMLIARIQDVREGETIAAVILGSLPRCSVRCRVGVRCARQLVTRLSTQGGFHEHPAEPHLQKC